MIFSKERIIIGLGLLMFVIGMIPSWYIQDLRMQVVFAEMGKEFGHHAPSGMNYSILGPITCPSILAAGETIRVRAQVNIPEDLLSEYRIYMRREDFSETQSESIVIEEVTDWRETNQTGDSKSQFLWNVTISQPGIYGYVVYARNKADDKDQNSYYPGGRWGNSDLERCTLPVMRNIGFSGNQILTINKFWIAMCLIAGLGICVRLLITYPSHRKILIIWLITFPGISALYLIFPFLPFELFVLLSLIYFHIIFLVFLMIPHRQKSTVEMEGSSILFTSIEKGQGLVEFAVILVLTTIIVVVILALLGPAIGNVFSQIGCVY